MGRSASGGAAALARRHTKAAVKVLVLALRDPRYRVRAALALLDRGWGPPARAQPAGARAVEALGDTELDATIAWLRARIAAERAAGDAPAVPEGSPANTSINPMSREAAASAAPGAAPAEAPPAIGPAPETTAIRAATACPARHDAPAARRKRHPLPRDWDRPLYDNGRPWHAIGPAPPRGQPLYP